MTAYRSVHRFGQLYRGFTLLEVLVVMALLSIIMLAMMSALRSVGQGSDRVQERLQRLDDQRVSVAFLRSVLGRVSGRQVVRPVGTGPLFEGAADHVAWVGVMPARHGFGGRFFFRLGMEPASQGQALVLRFVPWADQSEFPDWSSAAFQTIFANVQSVVLRYEDHLHCAARRRPAPGDVGCPDAAFARVGSPPWRRRHCGGGAMMASRHRGMALVAVLWLVAAISVIATGLMQTIRFEARAMAQMQDLTRASALGESAMQLALQALVVAAKQLDRRVDEQIAVAGVDVAVQAFPLNGYLDINKAPVELLHQALLVAAGLPAARAEQLAQAVVEHRSALGPGGKPNVFEAPEDLMRVPGLDYSVYARVAGLITADIQGTGGINPMAAPPQVLRVLAAGNDAAVEQFVAGRDAGQVGLDQSAFNGAWLDPSGSSHIELQALVPLPDGAFARIVRRYLVGKSNSDGLPWRVFYAASFYDPPASAGP